MRQLVMLVGCAVVLLGLGGCQGQSAKLLEGKRVVLPPDIAGTWKARGEPWEIVLSPDGTVSSALIPMGAVEVRPNQTTEVEMKDGSISTFKAGDCAVEYTPATRELFVAVEVEEMHIRFSDNRIDGSSIDTFTGPVSEDGKEWTTDWVKIFDYGPRFPQGPIYAEPLTFEKIED